MRKRLGSLEKSPIEKLTHGAQRGSFGILACIVSLLLVHLGVDFGVGFYNFLEFNMETYDFVNNRAPTIWYAKGVIALITILFILKRQ